LNNKVPPQSLLVPTPTEAAPPVTPLLSEDDVKKMNVNELKAALTKRGMRTNGKKADLTGRLVDAVQKNAPLLQNMSATILDNRAGDDFDNQAYWKIMEADGDAIDENAALGIDGVIFRNPTTPADEVDTDGVGPKKINFTNTCDRSPFISYTILPEMNKNGQPKKKHGKYIYSKQMTNQTVPNFTFLHKNGINCESHPADYVNMFIPWKKSKWNEGLFDIASITEHTNMRINCSLGGKLGGGKKCGEFSIDEIMSFFGLYMMNGLNPSPKVHMKFKTQEQDEVQGNDVCNAVFGPQAESRHVQFKRYLTLVDLRTASPSRETNPNYKINPIVKQLIKASQSAMIIGEWVSVDEQTIGFKGNHIDKLRINYKKAGDGFQCDALCADGYTYTVYFRNVKAPTDLLNKGLSPLHA